MEAQGIVSAAEFDRVMAQALADVQSPRYRCVSPFHIAYGQRPF